MSSWWSRPVPIAISSFAERSMSSACDSGLSLPKSELRVAPRAAIGIGLTLLAVLLLTSKGAAGVTGSGFIVLAATLSALGTLPVTAVALILGIDRFMSEARALTNLVGNGVATLVVAKWCGALDEQRLQQELRK